MGRPNIPQPDYSPLHSESVVPMPGSPCSDVHVQLLDEIGSPRLLRGPPQETALKPPLSSSLPVFPQPLWFDAKEDFSPPPSPLSDAGDVFFDADDNLIDELILEPPFPPKPARTSVFQAPLEGVAKGRMGVAPSRNGARLVPYTFSALPAHCPAPVRGSSKPMVSQASITSSAAPLALQAKRSLAPAPIPTAANRPPAKKAVLIGINYPLLKENRLWHAVKDAVRFGESLKKLGFPPEDIRILADEPGYEPPTASAISKYIAWLVHGAMANDILYFAFSGHCSNRTGLGPSLVTSDLSFIDRDMLHRELVLKVPTGCELQIIFDCCHAAGIIRLPYCIGKMVDKMAHTLTIGEEATKHESEVESQSEKRLSASALPCSASPKTAPQRASLFGLPNTGNTTSASPPPPPPPFMVDQESFGTPASAASNRPPKGGVVAAPPLLGAGADTPMPTRPATPPLSARLAAVGHTLSTTSSALSMWTPASTNPRRGRQVVVEGDHLPDYFEERDGEGTVRPPGKVMVWAGSGERQLAFEASGNVGNGIVTDAMCSAMDTCVTNTLTQRDLWHYVVGAIDKENSQRSERDAKKAPANRKDPRQRVQHAELWVSQAEPLTSAAPVLDQPVFPHPRQQIA